MDELEKRLDERARTIAMSAAFKAWDGSVVTPAQAAERIQPSWAHMIEAAIVAYLSALPPPSAEVAEMVRRLRDCADESEPAFDLMREAAALLERLAAQPAIAEGWRKTADQHIGWLAMYAETMDETNWRDLRASIGQQVRELSAHIDAIAPFPAGEGEAVMNALLDRAARDGLGPHGRSRTDGGR